MSEQSQVEPVFNVEEHYEARAEPVRLHPETETFPPYTTTQAKSEHRGDDEKSGLDYGQPFEPRSTNPLNLPLPSEVSEGSAPPVLPSSLLK